MYCDLPVLRRCCFCLPLRPGLIAWGYIKMVAVIIFLSLLSIIIYSNFRSLLYREVYKPDTFNLVLQSLLFFSLVVDIAFNVVFLVSAHKKNQALMKACFYYNIYVFIVSNIIFLLFTGYITLIVYMWQFLFGEILLFCLAVGFVNAVLQFYIILLIRSEVQKLSNDCYFRFENHAGASQCVMTIGNLNIDVATPQKQDKLELIKEEVTPGKV